MSMQFCAAATILGKPVALFAFYAKHYDDSEVSELAKKVQLVPEKDRSKPRFEVYLRDGRIYIAAEEISNRAPHIPTRDNAEKKFRALASGSSGEKGVERIIDLVMNLDKVNNVRVLTANLSQS